MGRSAQIDVEEISHGLYDVVVDEFVSARSFRVSLKDETFEKLGRGRTREQLIRDAFRFLLTREPKENILESFEIFDIATYFPEFESTL